MSRDKQIKEMAKILCRDYSMGECMVDSFDCLEGHCSKRERIEALYNAGYRKASDVAEEIFAEIEKALRENQFTLIPPYRSEITDWKTVFRLKLADDIAELKKKYTEEGK